MNKKELYNEIIEMIPVKATDTDFKKHIKNTLEEYKTRVSKLDKNYQTKDWNQNINRMNQLCNGILRAIESDYKGTRHSAYISIKNQLDGYKTSKNNIKGLAIDDNIRLIPEGTIFYRMRKVNIDEHHKLTRKDMFHIPLNQRGSVRTQRYSVPGYPCLYLSHRVYGCWEEMGRPDYGTIMVSSYKCTESFNMLDLRIPSFTAWNNDINRCILLFPLIMSCMFQVNNKNDIYKPEYIVPQLITEWIITRNKSNKNAKNILGVIYTSTHKNNDFSFPDDSFDNYAIPVIEPINSKDYCKKLKNIFNLTLPTYYDLEELRQGMIIDGGIFGFKTEEEERREDIRNSKFGYLEKYLEDYPFESIDL